MQTPRTLLVHVDDSDRSAARLMIAADLADRFDAQVCVHYASLPHLLSAVGVPSAIGAGVAAEMAAHLHEERRATARAAFDRGWGRSSRLRWCDADGDPYESLRQRALYADLAILGQDNGERLPVDQPVRLVSKLLEQSGRPALVVPCMGMVRAVGQHIAIAWKPTPAAARAIAAAVPWLRDAQRVDVLTFGENAQAEQRGIDRWLDGHGIEATLHHETSRPRDVAELLLSRVAELQADLLVMGCYGHSHVREWMLGGVTRTLLRSMTVPVLMMH